MYEFSSEDLWKEWYWSERYPTQKELRSYFEHVEKKLDVKKDVCFDTRVTGAHFNASKDRWIIITENGVTAQAKFLCLCLGFGSKPYIPDLPNLSSFRGSGGIIHSARWPRDGADIKRKRVGVIGTGASGVQIIQTLASLPPDEGPKQLTVFQRTPNLAIPMRQEKLDRVSQDKAKALYPMLYRRRRQTAGEWYLQLPIIKHPNKAPQLALVSIDIPKTSSMPPRKNDFCFWKIFGKPGASHFYLPTSMIF